MQKRSIFTLRPALLAAALAALLAGCAGASHSGVNAAPTPPSAASPAPAAAAPTPAAQPAWLLPPCVEARYIEPIGIALQSGETFPQYAGWYVAGEQGTWYLIDSSGALVSSVALRHQPLFGSCGHLIPAELRAVQGAAQTFYDDLAADLQTAGAPFELEPGHGGANRSYVMDAASGVLYQLRNVEVNTTVTPVAELPPDQAPQTLLGAALGGDWYTTEMDAQPVFAPQPHSLYAVFAPDGARLTEFSYAATAVPSGRLIAVQDPETGLWGYCDAAGELVIPCSYTAFWGIEYAGEYDAATGDYQDVWRSGCYPAPEQGGAVVVRTTDGAYALLNAGGEVLIPAGSYQALAPAQPGTLWAKQDGVWGLLTLPGT